jgi:hypothetical protein
MVRRLIASVLIVSLVLLTPGGRFYEACAQVVSVPAAGVSAANAAGASGTIHLQLGAPALSGNLSLSGMNGSLLAPSAPAPLAIAAVPAAFAPSAVFVAASAVPAAAPVVPAALQPLKAAAAKPLAPGTANVPAASAPKAFTAKTTGEDAAILFDQGLARPGALDDVPAPAASDSEAPNPGGLELAKTPNVPGAPAEPPAPGRAKLPRSMWGLFWGHHITTVFGVNFHVLSQAFLVKDALGMGTAVMGLVRNIHMGSMALVNFLPIGYLIDKTDYRVVFVATSLARAALMAAIPLLFMVGGLHFTILAAIVAVNPIFQSTMIVADGAARKSFLGKDAALNKDAAATLGKWDSIAGAIMPIVAGWVIGLMVTGFGLGGYAMAYGVYGALLVASIPFYWFMVRDARFAENDRLTPWKFAGQTAVFMTALLASVVHPFTLILTWSFRSFFRHDRAEFPATSGARALWAAKELLVGLAGAALLPLALLKGLLRVPALLKAARASSAGGRTLADALEGYKPTQGLAFILRNRTLRVLTMVMALEVLLIDALPFVVIPSLITDAVGSAPATLAVPLWTAAAAAVAAVLAAGARALKLVKDWKVPAGLAALAAAAAALHFFPGILLTQVATAGGVMGLLFSVEYVGRFLPSVRLEGEKGDAIIEKKGHGSFYRKAAVASLLFWALLLPAFVTTGMFWLNLAIVGGVLFGVQYFNTPVGIVLEPVKRAEMDDDKLARIESAVFMVDVAFESVGALLIGLLLDYAGLKAALIAVAAFLTFTAVLQYQVPKWIFPDGNRPAKKTPPPPDAPQASLRAAARVFA